MSILEIPGPLVSPKWLARHLGQLQLVVLEASLNPVGGSKAGQGKDEGLEIPGTLKFDFDKKICDRESALPHMMPSAQLFTQEVRSLGINCDSVIVVYDRIGIYSSPRAWWMFKAMGHEQVAVLDGGMPAWLELGMPCHPAIKHVAAAMRGNFAAEPQVGFFCDLDYVTQAIHNDSYTIMDARSEKRFSGLEPEPRAGLRSGHIPGSCNLPFKEVLMGHYLKTPQELKAIFAAEAKPEQQLICSCGSGVTACILALAATLCGYKKIAVYDGSWSEWGLVSSRPMA